MAEADVAQADVYKRLQIAVNGRDRLEELGRLRDRHVQHFCDVLALVAHFKGFAVVACAAADLARHVNIGQEVHLDFDGAVTTTRLTAPALDVEGEAPRLVAAHLGLLRFRKQGTDLVKHARVGCRV